MRYVLHSGKETAEIVEKGLLTQDQWDTVSGYALKLFARGRDMARERGLILVDTKYEFGFDDAGNIVLADEIHTPDSSRYWFLESYAARFAAGEKPESFDKDFVRTWVNARCNPYEDEIPTIPDDVRSPPVNAAHVRHQVAPAVGHEDVVARVDVDVEAVLRESRPEMRAAELAEASAQDERAVAGLRPIA